MKKLLCGLLAISSFSVFAQSWLYTVVNPYTPGVPNALMKCTLDVSGNASNCTRTAREVPRPWNVQLSKDNGTTYGYISNEDGSRYGTPIYRCVVTPSNGDLANCTPTGVDGNREQASYSNAS